MQKWGYYVKFFTIQLIIHKIMSKQIISTWGEKKPYTVEKPIYVNGEYAIYKQFDKCYLYTYKNMAINQLAGVNKAHVDALAMGERPIDRSMYIYDDAMRIVANFDKVGILPQK